MTWNYRVVVDDRSEDEGFHTYAIHEAYYNQYGVLDGITKEPVAAQGDSSAELLTDLMRQVEAILKPVISGKEMDERERAVEHGDP